MPISQTRQGQGTAGRDHSPAGFTTWLAFWGGKRGHVHGATVEDRPQSCRKALSVHHFHTTLLHLLGLNYRDLVFERQGLKERITDHTPPG